MKYRLLLGRTDADFATVEQAADKVADEGSALMAAIDLVKGPLEEIRSDGDPHALLMEVGQADVSMLSVRDECPGVVVWMIEAKDVAAARSTLQKIFSDPDVQVHLEIDGETETGWVRTTREFGPNDVESMPQGAVSYGRCLMQLCGDADHLGGALVVIGTCGD